MSEPNIRPRWENAEVAVRRVAKWVVDSSSEDQRWRCQLPTFEDRGVVQG